MKNPEDYKAEWTTAIVNPDTGKTCFGGAARNVRLKQKQGIENIRTQTYVAAVETFQPIMNQYQNQLEKSNQLLKKALAKLATQAENSKPK